MYKFTFTLILEQNKRAEMITVTEKTKAKAVKKVEKIASKVLGHNVIDNPLIRYQLESVETVL